MKPLTKCLVTIALGGTLSLIAAAVPPSKSVQPHRPWTHAEFRATPTPASTEKSGLMCERMLVPKTGAQKRAQYVYVTCTAEMMKNDVRCRQACGL